MDDLHINYLANSRKIFPGTGSIFGSTFASSANSPSTTASGGFTFGAKPANSSGGLFGTSATTTPLTAAATTTTTTTATTTASANTTASIFSPSLGRS